MNKIKIDGVLIVEGKDDVSYLSSFIDALFFTTQGYDLNKEKISFLSRASSKNKLIIFTDPDEAGERIRNKIKTSIKPIFEAKCEKITRKNKKKSGIAEMEKTAVVEALKDFTTTREISRYNYRLSSLISLSDNPGVTRQKIIDKYGLIYGNNSSVENQLNILKVTPQELEEFINGN